MADNAKKGHDDHAEGHSKKGHGKRHGHGGGHGGGHAEGEHEGAPEWLISFADNVMLQMGFFVILLALNMGPKGGGQGEAQGAAQTMEQNESFVDWALAVRAAFNNPVDPNSTRPQDAALVQRLRERQGASDRGRTGENERVESVRPTGFSSLGGTIRFIDGSAALSAAERDAVTQIARGIRGLRWMVEVRGHVSPAESIRDPRAGWRLSHERAYAVAAALVEDGLEWSQIRLVSSGPNAPLTEGRVYDAQALRSNQRAEIIVTNEPMPD